MANHHDSSGQSYQLAPMSGLILGVTIAVLPLPILMAYLTRSYGLIGWIPAAFVAAIYSIVWFYMRPSRFEITGASLDIVWPLRRTFSIPIGEVESVEQLSHREFRDRYGLGMRIGAGGLWGGFGLYKTKGTTFRFYISRQDDYVIVRSRVERPLLITPADPGRFAESLGRLL